MGHFDAGMHWLAALDFERAAAAAQFGIASAKDPLFASANACVLAVALMADLRAEAARAAASLARPQAARDLADLVLAHAARANLLQEPR